MLISDLLKDKDFKLLNDKLNDTEIKGLYCGDLLSWVMSHAQDGDLWCTVLTHVNIVAIASLLKLSCVVICENAPIDKDTIIKANKEKINILSTKLKSTEVIKKLVEYEKTLL